MRIELGHENAERVTGRIRVDAERLVRVVTEVAEQPGAECDRPLMLGVQVRFRGDGQVEV